MPHRCTWPYPLKTMPGSRQITFRLVIAAEQRQIRVMALARSNCHGNQNENSLLRNIYPVRSQPHTQARSCRLARACGIRGQDLCLVVTNNATAFFGSGPCLLVLPLVTRPPVIRPPLRSFTSTNCLARRYESLGRDDTSALYAALRGVLTEHCVGRPTVGANRKWPGSLTGKPIVGGKRSNRETRTLEILVFIRSTLLKLAFLSDCLSLSAFTSRFSLGI